MENRGAVKELNCGSERECNCKILQRRRQIKGYLTSFGTAFRFGGSSASLSQAQPGMVANHSIWVHGVSAIPKDVGVSYDDELRAIAKPFIRLITAFSPKGQIFFSIPTPVLLHERRLRASDVTLHCRIGGKAHVTSVHVRDGDTIIGKFNGLTTGVGALQRMKWPIPNKPEISGGIAICVDIQFEKRHPDAFVEFVGAGIDFE